MKVIMAYLAFQAALILVMAITEPMVFIWAVIALAANFGLMYLFGRYFGMFRKKD